MLTRRVRNRQCISEKNIHLTRLSLVLVAVLLVSAVPFQASASTYDNETDTWDVPVYVTIDGEQVNTLKHIYIKSGETMTIDAAKAQEMVNDWNNREFVCWTNSLGNSFTSATLYADNLTEDFSLMICLKSTTVEHTHDYALIASQAADCKNSGYNTYKCDGCGDSYTDIIAAQGHDWGDWSETKAATTTEDGSEKRTCKTCGETETQTIPATGEYTINLIADGATVQTLTLKKGDKVPALQTPSAKKGYTFKGYWSGANGTGTQLVAGYTWNGGETTYYAYYQENLEDDGVSVLSIRMKVYVGSVQKNDVLLYNVTLDDSTKILSYLMNNEGTIENAVFNAIDSSKYEWIDRVYYDNDSSAELTSQATLADGDKSVFIKVHAKESTQTNVQLYIHSYNSTSKTYTTLKVVDVKGYTKGNTITLSAMKTIANKYYTFTAIKGLYSADAWAQLLNGEKPTAASSLTVSDTGTVKYHVILTGASAASSSETADSTNPKTGDMIIVPVIFMLASAAAVALVYMGTKKRIVK